MPTRKKVFNKGDRFACSSGWGYVTDNNQALIFGPKKGRDSKFVYADEIPDDAKFMIKCPDSVNLAMDALDLILNPLISEKNNNTEAQIEAV